MTAGQSTTCGVCGEKVVTLAKPIVTGHVLCKYGLAPVTVGSVIDLDAHWADYSTHYAEQHPDVALPARLW